ncbi:MAG: Ig-like domain-containing protein, partial [Planctomycetota bacterium]
GSAFTGFDDTIADYVDTAFMVDGIVADLNQLRLGGNAAASFSAALIDGIVEVAGPTAPAGFSLLSEPIFVTIDTEAPATGTIDLLASSDTGTFSTDNVTSTRTPGFTGTGPANGIVHVFAQASDPTTGAAIGSPLLVGSGTVGSDVTDTVVGNGQGQWNVTTIPIDDGLWYFTARFEDDAGLLSDPVGVPALPAPVFGNQNFSFGSPATLTSDVSRANFNSFISLVGDAVGQMIPVVNVEATATTAHPVPASVSLSLTSPAGTTVGLSPTVPTGSFSGENAVGTWTLTASDLVNDGIDGTLTNFNLFVTTALPVVIDTIAPNPPILDLTSDSDSGRDNTDEITNDDTITVTMTTNDSAVSQTNLLFQDNLRYVVYDRFNTEAEFVLYDSSLDAAVESTSILGDLLTSQNFVTETLGTQFIGLNAPNQAVLAGGILADGIHELKLEVLDRAGNISQSFLLPLTVDTIAPPISFGLSTVASDGLFDGSDTGTAGDGTSFSDRITSDTAPTLWGMAEANTVVSLWLDANGDGLIQATGAAADIFLGQTVANPLDGNAAFPPGYWQISSAIDLNDLTTINATGGTFARDGARPLLVSAQDQAGNPVAAAGVIGPALNGTILDALTIAVDTQGPQITGVRINAEQTGQFGGYDLFDPKPSINNPTPLINSITINFQDLPARVDAAGTANDFIYPALDPTVAGTIGNYRVVGDHVGEVVINSATVDQAVKVSGTVTAAVSTTTFSDVGLVGAAAPPTVGDFVVFTSGANTTQTRLISAYIPGTGTIMVDNAYGAAPAVGDGYSIVTATSMLHAGSFLPSTPPSLLNTVTAPAVGANTASAFTIFPTFTLGGSFVSAPTPGDYLYFHTGVNAGQIRRITNDPSFNSTVTVASAFGAVPAIGDSFSVLRRSLAPGNFNTASVTLTFATPLPDDRFTLTVSDNLVDPAGNKLDGESNATSPAPTNGFPASVTLPTGDSVAGGAFAGRFTVDSRPEIGSFVSQNINIDTNGNFVWDPATSQIGGDATNVDLTFNMQVANANGTVGLGSYGNHDLVFAGKFGLNGVGIPSGFDTLAVYGFSVETNTRRWLVDTNHDGVITTGTDIISTQLPVAGFNEVGALPIAGNFDGNAANGDEIGLYFAGQWALDTNRNFVIDGADTFLNGNMFGHPIVGDFDGNGEDDLGVFNNNQFFFDMNVAGFDGNFENANTINWGFPGVLDRPVAADMDQDGIDDIGLWVPRNSAQDNRTIAEWYFLVSGNPLAFIVGGAAGTTALINHPFTPVPFGNDLYAEFGDELALPIVGNFDPPVAIEAADGQNVPDTGDFDGDGDMDGSDFLAWQRGYTMTGTPSMADGDGNSDGTVDQLDVELWAAAYQAAETSSLSQSNEGGADIGNQFDNGSDFLSWQRDLTSTNVAAAISSFDAELVAAAAASSRAPFAAPAREMAFADLGESDPFEFGEQAAAPQSADLALAAKIADDEVSAGGTANSDAAAYALALTLDDEGLLGDWL